MSGSTERWITALVVAISPSREDPAVERTRSPCIDADDAMLDDRIGGRPASQPPCLAPRRCMSRDRRCGLRPVEWAESPGGTRLGLREARPKTTRLQTARVQSAEPARCVHDRGALRDRLEVGSSLFFWEPKMGCGLLANSMCTPVEVSELVQVGVLGAGDHAGACH